jgi:hypothetical protein
MKEQEFRNEKNRTGANWNNKTATDKCNELKSISFIQNEQKGMLLD